MKSVRKNKGAGNGGKNTARIIQEKGAPKAKGKVAAGSVDQWRLRLYIAGQTPRSIAALANLKAFCKEELDDTCRIEVIDLLKEPWRAREDQIVAIPTLVRSLPVPIRQIIGDLSNKERVLSGFDLQLRGKLKVD